MFHFGPRSDANTTITNALQNIFIEILVTFGNELEENLELTNYYLIKRKGRKGNGED